MKRTRKGKSPRSVPTADSAALAAQLAELVPRVWEADRAFAAQLGIEDDETFEECLGAPCKASDLTALERLRGPLPPSYRAFLSLYGRWRGFCGGADALGAKEHATPFIKSVLANKSDLFAEFADRDPIAQGAYPFAIGDDRSYVLIEPSPQRPGQMDFVKYYLTDEEGRFPDLIALLEHRLATTTKSLKKPKPGATRLGGILEKLAKTTSTGDGFDLRVEWKGKLLDSVEIRSGDNGKAVAELVKLDAARAVKTLILGGTDDYAAAVATMAKSGWPKGVVRLSLGHQRAGERIPGLVKLGDPTPALNQYAKLQLLDLTPGGARLGKLALGSLRELTLRGCLPQQCEAIAAAVWPKLARLTLHIGDDKSLVWLLVAKLRAPKLVELGIAMWRNDQVPLVAKALAASPWAGKVKTLRIVVSEGDEYLEERLREALRTAGAPKLELKLAVEADE